MASLKTIVPDVAGVVGVRPDKLNEYLRTFVRADLLELRPGKGPGSGVVANSRTLSILLLGIMTAEKQSDAAELVYEIGKMPEVTGVTVTGKRSFLDNLSLILSQPELAHSVSEVSVERHLLGNRMGRCLIGKIGWSGTGRGRTDTFASRNALGLIGQPGLRMRGFLDGISVQGLHAVLERAAEKKS